MKEIIKKTLSVIIIVCVIFGLVPTQKAQAYTRLSKEDLTMYEGESTRIKVKGSSKKFKWSSSNKSVATVDQTGKITAKTEGFAIIYAKIGKEKLSCSVDVLFNKEKALKSIRVTPGILLDGAMAFIQNNYIENVEVSISFAFYDKNGKIVYTDEAEYINVPKGNFCMERIYADVLENGIYSVDATISDVSKDYSVNKPSNISLSNKNRTEDGIQLQVKNECGQTISKARVTCIYWKDEDIVGCERSFIYDLPPYSRKFITISNPAFKKYEIDEYGDYDWDYVNINYDRYELFVDYACYSKY